MKPIIFSGEMVRAILDGRKTMTRRVIKPQPAKDYIFCYCNRPGGDWCTNKNPNKTWAMFRPQNWPEATTAFDQKYGHGDTLWVRETWSGNGYIDGKQLFIYKADLDECGRISSENLDEADIKWRPSIHMPKEACRLFLKITDLRIQRLRGITEEDALKEGCKVCKGGYVFPGTAYDKIGLCHGSPEMAFQVMWGELYPDGGINPWVVAIIFEIIKIPAN